MPDVIPTPSVVTPESDAGGAFKNHYYSGWVVKITRGADATEYRKRVTQIAQGSIEGLQKVNNAQNALNEAKKKLKDSYISSHSRANMTTDEQAKVARDAEIFADTNPTILSLKTTLETQKKALEETKKKAEKDFEDAIANAKTTDISSIIKDLRVDLTDDKLAETKLSFSDKLGEIYGAIAIGDYVSVQIGWKGDSSPRYRIQQVFTGIITGKNYVSGPSTTDITACDERVLLGSINKTQASGSDGISDDDHAKDVFNKAGLNTLNEGGGEKATKIQLNESDLSYIARTAEANGQKMTVLEPGPPPIYGVIPKTLKENMFAYAWNDNLISLQASESWRLPDDQGGEGGFNEDKGPIPPVEPPPNIDPNKDDNGNNNPANQNREPEDTQKPLPIVDVKPENGLPQPLGNDPNVYRTLTERFQKENAAKEIALANIDSDCKVTVRGEPKMTNRSLIHLSNINKNLNGFYEVISCTHILGHQLFTTEINCKIYGKPELIDINRVLVNYEKSKRTTQNENPVSHPSEQAQEALETDGMPRIWDNSRFGEPELL